MSMWEVKANSARRSRRSVAVLRAGLQALLAALCAATGATAQAQDISFGNAAPYGLLVFEDLRGSVKADGRIAVGGSLKVTSGLAGLTLSEPSRLPVVVVRGDIGGWQQGALVNADQTGFGVYLGLKAGEDSVNATIDLRQVDASPLDFDGERMHLGVLSEQLRDLLPTGTVTEGQGVLTLVGTKAAREVFTLTAAQAASGAALVLNNVLSDAQIVVNVRADANRQLVLGIDTAALEPWKGRVLFNSRDAEQIQLNGQILWGALLAPDSCVCTRSTGRVEGAVVVRSWDTDMALGFVPFIARQ